jgi:hypothetical protein
MEKTVLWSEMVGGGSSEKAALLRGRVTGGGGGKRWEAASPGNSTHPDSLGLVDTFPSHKLLARIAGYSSAFFSPLWGGVGRMTAG